jgi:hypothetical protein
MKKLKIIPLTESFINAVIALAKTKEGYLKHEITVYIITLTFEKPEQARDFNTLRDLHFNHAKETIGKTCLIQQYK